MHPDESMNKEASRSNITTLILTDYQSGNLEFIPSFSDSISIPEADDLPILYHRSTIIESLKILFLGFGRTARSSTTPHHENS
jgi:hypothetical protein